MARYAKGANAERELIGILWGNGFAAVRAAGSGKATLPSPDMVAMKNGRIIAFECKAWKGDYLNISREQMSDLSLWCDRAGAEFFIAWRVPRVGWIFVRKNDLKETGKAHIISISEAAEKGLGIECFSPNKGKEKAITARK